MNTRREFLKISSLASAAFLTPAFLQSACNRSYESNGKKLVIIQLSGGNDGLNTVVPYQNDLYYNARQSLGVSASEVIKLNDEQGLNPVMQPFYELYDEGMVSILNAVGYPNPNRSHFRSMDIWHTATDSDQYTETGWLGRYLDHSCSGCAEPHLLVEIDDGLSLAVKGEEVKGLGVRDPKRLYEATQDKYLRALESNKPKENHDALSYLYKTMTETISSAEYIYEKSNAKKTNRTYPVNEFGRKLKLISELIQSDVATEIFYVSLSGFDTHVRQRPQQDRLLKMYSEALKVFVDDLKVNGRLDDTLIMTFSEFGRRVSQNASGGTDHGKANNLFLIGGDLKNPGIFNPAPDLSKLDAGDVHYQIDFRQVYASVLKDWLGADDQLILGKSFTPLSII
ncbi:MAG: DUF1501 domain-containing protein [Bacteroidota bacterium]